VLRPLDKRDRLPTEDAYVERIVDYAQNSKRYLIYPGDNFQKVATFLHRKDLDPTEPAVSYATLYMLCLDESPSSAKSFISQDIGAAADLVAVDEKLRRSAAVNRLIFLRGFASSQWLRKVGWYYAVDPEFFRRHLDFSLFSRQRWFSSPSLPSTTMSIMQLRITTLARQEPGVENVDTARRDMQDDMNAYITSIAGEHGDPFRGQLGESIVRKINIHDEKYFSFEQDISITFCKSGRSWTGESHSHFWLTR